jgi:hypothetical protein
LRNIYLGVNGEDEALKGPPPIFEFFETRAPGDRPPLYNNILELAKGEGPPGGGEDGQKGEANPMLLEALNTDLDLARSWFAVAWYPILCHSQVPYSIDFFLFAVAWYPILCHSVPCCMQRTSVVHYSGALSYSARTAVWEKEKKALLFSSALFYATDTLFIALTPVLQGHSRVAGSLPCCRVTPVLQGTLLYSTHFYVAGYPVL